MLMIAVLISHEAVERLGRARKVVVPDVGIALRRRRIAVAHERLEFSFADGLALLEPARRRVPQVVPAEALNPRLLAHVPPQAVELKPRQLLVVSLMNGSRAECQRELSVSSSAMTRPRGAPPR